MAKLVIFDMDQTLLDLVPFHDKAYSKVFKEVFEDLVKFGTRNINTEEHALQVLKEGGLNEQVAKKTAPLLAASKTESGTNRFRRVRAGVWRFRWPVRCARSL